MKKTFSAILVALMSVATAVTLSSCDKSEPQPEYRFAYEIRPTQNLNLYNGFERVEPTAPVYEQAVSDVNEIVLTRRDVEMLRLCGNDSDQIVSYAQQLKDKIQTKLKDYEDELKSKGLSLSGYVDVYGGFDNDDLHARLTRVTFGHFVQAGSAVQVSVSGDTFIVTNAGGMTADLYFKDGWYKKYDIPNDPTTNSYKIVCPKVDGKFTLKVGDAEASINMSKPNRNGGVVAVIVIALQHL